VWGDVQVMVVNGELTLLDPSAPDPMPGVARLIPVAEHTFRIDAKENFGNDGELAIFCLDDQGKMISLKLGNTLTFPIDEW
jgi:hypothetical protein